MVDEWAEHQSAGWIQGSIGPKSDLISTEGRQLKTMVKTSTSLNFKYNSSGLRTDKTVNGVPTKYIYLGGKVAFETTGAETIHYTYDGSGAPFSMTYKGSEYFYLTNLQGDVTGLADAAGTTVVSYRYDIETGLYYLQSRYYNPEIGRFINADDLHILKDNLQDLNDKNQFSYCDNNPVIRIDEEGELWLSIVVGGAIGAAISIGSQLISGTSVKNINWKDVGGAAISGAVASVPGLKFVSTAMVGGLGNVLGGYSSGNIKSKKDLAVSFLSGTVANAFGYGTGKISSHYAKKAFNKLPRYVRKAKLEKIYSTKGSMRNKNLVTAAKDLDFGAKISPVRSFFYSTLSSELGGRISQRGLTYFGR